MATLNHAKIITALEALAESKDEAEFFYNFLLAYGTPKTTIALLRSNAKQRNVAQVAGDVGVPRSVYFRVVEKGASVSEAMEEILAMPLLEKHKIRFVLVTDFETVSAHDRKIRDVALFEFAELPKYYDFFLPLTGKYEKPIEYVEHPADVKACEKMGRLYDSICDANHYDNDGLHVLNVFLTRLLFCFFAEDTKIFPKPSQMTLAVEALTQKDGSDLTGFFETLFFALSTPYNAPERKELPQTFQDFPYVNGGLFLEQVSIPVFNARSRRLLLECGKMEWQEISPVIFGSMFQAVMNPERRRSMGAHYTSEKNILKVIRPLFLDTLQEELEAILEKKQGKKSALEAFHTKLSTLGFLDPACGCGNFLIVAYRELKELELKTVLALHGGGRERKLWMNVSLPALSKVTINQFYGIELEEFPVEVARVSMWLMEHVMNVRFGESLGCVFPSIPLCHSANIVCTNALTTPWEDVVEPAKLSYIFGNPPFVGKKEQTVEQKKELYSVFKDSPAKVGNLDYVCAWYKKATDYMKNNHNIIASFVSTNSICQGEQVEPLWKTLFSQGLLIHFAYTKFQWNNEARKSAAVHCIIIGFSLKRHKKYLFEIKNNTVHRKDVRNINAYLIDSNNIFITPQRNHLQSFVQKIQYGNMPIPKDFLIFKKQVYDGLSSHEKQYCKKIIGGDEHLGNEPHKYCLWIKEEQLSSVQHSEFFSNIISRTKKYRLGRNRSQTQTLAGMPWRFGEIRQPKNKYLLIPKVSSETRKYIPCSFYLPEVIASGSSLVIDNATLYTFAIISSVMHSIWMNTVCGRTKSDPQYSNSIVYNTFPWPETNEKQRQHIEELAQEVLDIREMYPDMTLAQLYNPETMPENLQQAHTALDLAVDKLYQKKDFANDDERLQLLFGLYAKLVE